MRIAITGASGLIGGNVAIASLDRGHDVVALAREGSNIEALETAGVAIQRADICNEGHQLCAAFAGTDIVIHTAATFSYHHSVAHLRQTAVDGTANVLSAAAEAGVRRVVLTSSSVVFGFSETPHVVDDTGPIVKSNEDPAYVAAKVAQDCLALGLAEKLGVELVIACPTITVGRTSSALGPSNSLILAYLADVTRSTYAGGCNIVSAADVGRGHVILAERGSPNQHYLLGSENVSWAELHSEIGRLTGVGGPNMELSSSLARAAAYVEEVRAKLECRPPLSTRAQASMLGRYYWYDDSRARALGYEPMSAAKALLEAVSWLIASSHVSRELRTQIRLAADVQRYRFKGLAA